MPYKSKAQFRWGAANFSKKKHEQWVKESPPYKSLPEEVGDKKKSPKKKRKK